MNSLAGPPVTDVVAEIEIKSPGNAGIGVVYRYTGSAEGGAVDPRAEGGETEASGDGPTTPDGAGDAEGLGDTDISAEGLGDPVGVATGLEHADRMSARHASRTPAVIPRIHHPHVCAQRPAQPAWNPPGSSAYGATIESEARSIAVLASKGPPGSIPHTRSTGPGATLDGMAYRIWKVTLAPGASVGPMAAQFSRNC